MTNDIVTQLRQDAQAQRDGAPEGACLWVADQFDRAANEIEHLRNHLKLAESVIRAEHLPFPATPKDNKEQL